MKQSVCLGALALTLAGCGGGLQPTAHTGPISTDMGQAQAAARAISAYRVANGLNPVTVDGTLNRTAEHQARAVAGAGYLSHDLAGSLGKRLDAHGVRSRYAAENLSAGSSGVDQVIQRWKNSPGHNSNLLMNGATRIGFVRADAPGSRYRRYWVLVLSDG